jgi:hypothetical protein
MINLLDMIFLLAMFGIAGFAAYKLYPKVKSLFSKKDDA